MTNLILLLSFIIGVHAVNYLVTKGVIYIALILFNTDWTSKFWVVYLMLILFSSIISRFNKFFNEGGGLK